MYKFRDEMHEFKDEMYEFRDEMHEFKDEMYDFKQEVYDLFDKNTKEIADEIHEIAKITAVKMEEKVKKEIKQEFREKVRKFIEIEEAEEKTAQNKMFDIKNPLEYAKGFKLLLQ